MVGSVPSDRSWQGIVRGLLFVAMAVFLVTIGIGILNGLDVYEFNRDQILTHVHSGTLGWITLSIVAATAWLVRGIDRRLAISMATLIPIYVVAFYAGIPVLRAVSGGLLLVVILWLFVWAWQAALANRSLPVLAVALGLTTFTYGAIIGVLRQLQLAGGPNLFPGTADVVGAHASAMVFSYLVLAAMGLLEWRIRGTTDRPTAGLVQLLALFGGGLLLTVTLLFLPPAALQPAGGIYLLVELIAVILFAVRVLPRALRVDWARASPGRHFATASIFVLVAVVIFLYVIYRFITNPALAQDPTSLIGVLTASDHATFIGVITNLSLGLGLALSADRAERWKWADQIFYWGMNIGLIVFLIGLIAASVELKRIGAPVMGVSILLGLAVVAARLRRSTLTAAEG
jgi:hypothetical protein